MPTTLSTPWKLFVGGLALVALAACPGPGGGDGGTDPTCPGKQARCGSGCIEVSSDINNCGGCNVVCPPPYGGGTAACVAGHCSATCQAGLEVCGARIDAGQVTLVCTDVSSDSANCGACGQRCSSQQSCTVGRCTDCPAGSLQCATASGGTVCKPVLTDINNCGGCGVTCDRPDGGAATCIAGHCSASCGAGAQLCSARLGPTGALTLICSDRNSDPSNCGGCGQVCLAQQSCSGGQCTNCASGQLQCPVSGSPGQTTCTGVMNDAANCGGCGNACGSGSRCDNGVCVGQSFTNCAGSSVDLQNDSRHCGACDVFCSSNESCRGGVCRPCLGAVCSNICVDTSTDSRNCGSCNSVCSGTQVCVGGTCAAPVAVRFLAPADTGSAPTGTFTQRVRVDSALPMTRVTLNMTRLGIDAGTLVMSFDPSLGAAGAPTSSWTTSLSIASGTVLSATATDIAWRADAGDAALHTATAQVGPLGVLPPPVVSPSISVTGPSGAAVPQNAWVGLNASPITLQATALGGAPAVQFINRSVSDTYVLGTAVADGGVATLTLSAAELATPAGITRVVACPVDAVGQVTAMTFCDAVSPTSHATMTVGRVPSTATLLTADADGGQSTLWWVYQSGLYAVPTDAVLPALPTSTIGATLYLAPLTPASDSTLGVLAIRGDGSALDRFDCASGGACNRQPYVSQPTGLLLASVHAQTLTSVLLRTSAGSYAFANNPGGSTPPAASLLGAAPSYPINAGNLAGIPSSVRTLGSGAIVVYTQATTIGGPYTLRLIHPSLPGGSVTLGATHNGPPIALRTFPTGEILWAWSDGSNGFMQAASFDGATLRLGNPTTGVLAPGQAALPAAELVRPQLVLGVASELLSTQPMMFVADFAPSLPVVTFPVVPSAAVGPVALQGVQTRRGLGPFAVSDDLAKAIFVTADPPDPDFTLWMLDLPSKSAGRVYSSPNLQGANGNTEFAPHFVHSAASWNTAVPGSAPPATLANVPAVVFGEALAPQAGLPTYLSEVRLFYGLYTSAASPPLPITVDRFAVTTPAAPGRTLADTESGAAILFATSRSAWFDLYSVPLTQTASSTATSTLVLDTISGFRLRDDKARLLALRGDGSMWTARLAPGTLPALTLRGLGEGGFSGQPPYSATVSPLSAFNFTPDGDHAWMLVDIDPGYAFNLAGSSTLRLLDLNGAHQNLGAQSFQYGPSPAPLPCFFNNAQTVVGYTVPPSLNGLQTSFYFENTSTLARAVPPVLFTAASGNNPSCLVSLDGSEARAMSASQAWLSVRGPALADSTAFGGPLISVLSAPATNAPYAAPMLNEYDLLRVPFSGTVQYLFKVWGRGAGSTAPMPYVPAAVGPITNLQVRRTPGSTALLLQYAGTVDPTSTFGMVVPLSGRLPPPPLVP